MRRITYTSDPDAFDSGLILKSGMLFEDIASTIADFEKYENSELVVYYHLYSGWRVAVCNNDIVYGFHNCAFNDYERHHAMRRGTPF